ncbi:hypothetical protein MCANPG14_02221 [Mycoplasmopsis canis PG 14]|nr:hypothetical protein MCANPG14_02221 [Mycoplasmopsis canis PG 14]
MNTFYFLFDKIIKIKNCEKIFWKINNLNMNIQSKNDKIDKKGDWIFMNYHTNSMNLQFEITQKKLRK